MSAYFVFVCLLLRLKDECLSECLCLNLLCIWNEWLVQCALCYRVNMSIECVTHGLYGGYSAYCNQWLTGYSCALQRSYNLNIAVALGQSWSTATPIFVQKKPKKFVFHPSICSGDIYVWKMGVSILTQRKWCWIFKWIVVYILVLNNKYQS